MERTKLSEQYFSAVQKFVVFDLGLSLLPVSGQTEASQLITQIVSKNNDHRSVACFFCHMQIPLLMLLMKECSMSHTQS